MGHDLKALVQTMIKETTSQSTTFKRKQHVEYLDEADLKKRLVDKPDQLQRIIDKGPIFELRRQELLCTPFVHSHRTTPIATRPCIRR